MLPGRAYIFVSIDIDFYLKYYIILATQEWSHRLMVRTLPFQGENTGSIPVGTT